MAPADAPIRAGLIFQQQELAVRLRRTLVEAGISINAEFNVEALRTADLSAHQVEVYIVNLESEIEGHLDEVTDLLEDAPMPVVFNDAGVSSDLSGWDQARWARHLAAKIRKGRSNLPPPPENAEAIPSPKRAAAVVEIDLAPSIDAAEPEPLLELLDLLGDEDDSPPSASVRGDQAAYAAELAVGMVDEQAADPRLTEDAGDWLESVESPEDAPAEGLDWGRSAEGQIQAETGADESPLPDFTTDPAAPVPTLDDPGMLAELLGEASTQNDSDHSIFEGADLGIDDLTVDDSIDTLGDAMSVDPDDTIDGLEAPSSADFGSVDWEGGDAVLAEIETFSEAEFNPPATAETTDFLGQDSSFGGLSLNLDATATESAGEKLVDLDALLASGSEDKAEGLPTLSVLDAHLPPTPAASQEPVADELSELPDLDSWSLEPLPGEEASLPLAGPPKASETLTKRVQPVPEPTTSLEDLSLSFDDLGLVPLEGEQAPPPMVRRSPPAPAVKVPSARPPATPRKPSPAAAAPAPAPAASSAGPRKIVILGASIGGPDSIRDFLSRLNTDLHGAFILVQHMGAEFLDLMAQQLDRVSPLAVNLARHGHAIREGEVVIAPVGQRLRIDEDCKLDLSADAGPTAYSPSIDQVLSDSLERWGADRLLVIIFSGMASDAVEGSKQLAAAGTPIWAQDPASCVISSMVDGVVAAKVVNFIGSPEQLAEQANRLLA